MANPLLPDASDTPEIISPDDLKAFFQNMDEAHAAGYGRAGAYVSQRSILEERLRKAVGMTMPPHRYA